MFHRNIYICALGTILIFVSLFFLFKMTLNPQYYLHQTSRPRFICFIVQHFIGLIMLIKLIYQKFVYDHVVWGLQLSSINSFLMVFTQTYIRINYRFTRLDPSYSKQPLQLGFLNCYFLVLMYSLIGLFLTSVYILFIKGVQYWQARRIRIAIQRYLKQVPYDKQMIQLDCPICLNSFNQTDLMSKIQQCNHLFHKQCIEDWVKVNTNCPMCRKSLYDNTQQVSSRINYQQIINNPQFQ